MGELTETGSTRSKTIERRAKVLDLLLSLAVGLAVLVLFHLDHLVASYRGWSDPYWWLHLLVDSSYVVVYGGLCFVALRGWRIWRSGRRQSVTPRSERQ